MVGNPKEKKSLNLDPHFTHYLQNQSQVILNLNGKYETIKPLKNNTEEYFHDPTIGKDFLSKTQKTLSGKENTETLITSVYPKTPLRV